MSVFAFRHSERRSGVGVWRRRHLCRQCREQRRQMLTVQFLWQEGRGSARPGSQERGGRSDGAAGFQKVC